MSVSLININAENVSKFLDWNEVVNAIETALLSVTEKKINQPPRTFTHVLGTNNILLSMPGYLHNQNDGILACKLVTSFPNNKLKTPPLPSINANIFLFNENTGHLKAIIEATEITAWRTAAASVVATKHLHFSVPSKKNDTLAIIGAGTQGRIHAIAFHHFFKFKEVRIWNRHAEKAEILVNELIGLGIPAKCFKQRIDCVKNADVIVTATYSSEPLVELKWVKNNVHINAVGAGVIHYSELNRDIYQNATLYVDDLQSAKSELKGLEENYGVLINNELGEIIQHKKSYPNGNQITIFQSLGIAVEDAAVAHLIYQHYVDTADKTK